MVVSSGEKIISITKRQFKFLKSFLATGDFEESAKQAGVERSTAVRWFRDPKFRQFLKERLQWAADRNGCTFEWAVSQLKGTWEGKQLKTKIQFECMKELNRMLGHVKEIPQGGINAGEFINAEYVVIQKGGAFNPGFKPAQIPGNSRQLEGQVYLPDMRASMGQDNVNGVEDDKGDSQTPLGGVVCDQPAQASQGHDLAQVSANPSP